MIPAIWLLILIGPWLVVTPLAVAAGLSFPGLWRPETQRPPRVTGPRPVRWAVAA